jgi:hypothetical protein
MSTIPGSTLFVIELATGPLLDPEELLPEPLPNVPPLPNEPLPDDPPLKLNEQPLLPQLPLKPRPCAGPNTRLRVGCVFVVVPLQMKCPPRTPAASSTTTATTALIRDPSEEVMGLSR